MTTTIAKYGDIDDATGRGGVRWAPPEAEGLPVGAPTPRGSGPKPEGSAVAAVGLKVWSPRPSIWNLVFFLIIWISGLVSSPISGHQWAAAHHLAQNASCLR